MVCNFLKVYPQLIQSPQMKFSLAQKLFTNASISVLVILLSHTLYAQHPSAVADQINKLMPKPVHKTPNVAAIERYGNYEVNLFNGLPSISIPIFEVQSGDLRMPISLSYHAAGFKYKDQASWVGLGWSLVAGGQISRSLEGKPDESGSSGFLAITNDYNIQFTPNCTDFPYKQNTLVSGLDREADVFNYTFPGKSGGFYLRQGGQSPYLFPEAPIKISHPTGLNFFDVTDETGVRYRFGENNQNPSSTENTSSTAASYRTAWHLTEVHSPDSDDMISITYQSIGTFLTTDISHNITVVDDCFTEDPVYLPCPQLNPILTVSEPWSMTTQKAIDEINFESGKVKFIKTTAERTDLPGTFGLDRIEIYRKEGNGFVLVKTFKFVTNYFGGGGSRLKLDALEVYDGAGTFINKHQFTYHTNTFSWDQPNNSSCRDWFGFYNGKVTNTNLIPHQTIVINPTMNGNPENLPIGGAMDREPDTTFLKEAVLKRITFPTGGYTEFDFEPHQYQESGQTKYGGGLRVRRIRSVTGGSTVFKEYKYGTGESGNGWKNFDVRSFAFVNDNLIRTETMVGPPQNQYSAFQQYRSRMFFSSSALGPFYQDTPVFYTRVTEYQNGAGSYGKTVYEFDNNSPINDATYSVPHSNRTFWNSMAWARGKLTKKTVYNSAGQPVSQTDIGYTLLKSQNSHVSQGVMEYIIGNCTMCNLLIFVRCELPWPNIQDAFKYQSWNFQKTTGAYRESSRTETLFSNGLPNHVTTYIKQYEPLNMQVVHDETRVSTNPEAVVTKYRYHFQFINTASNFTNQGQLLKQMILNNQVNQPVEQYNMTQNIDGSNQKILSGQIVQYASLPGSSTRIKPASIFFFETATPILPANYVQYGINGSAAMTMDSRYRLRLSFNSYDAAGNLLQVTKVNDSPESYLWGYGGVYPVAQAKNATQSQIAFTSFETNEKGGWTYVGAEVPLFLGEAKTGRNVYNLSGGAITRSTDASTSNRYKVSFWARTVTGTQNWTVLGASESLSTTWKLVEREITSPSVSISGTNIYVDELRIHPLAAQMTTFTFFPLLGIQTQFDAKNHGMFYRYDSFGRLESIRNDDGHIVEHYEYNYKK